jgi:hypothetical protein
MIVELQVKVLDDPYGTDIRQGLVAEYSIMKLLRYCLKGKIDLFLILVVKQTDTIQMIERVLGKNKIFFIIPVYNTEFEGIRRANAIIFIASVTSR